MHTMSTNRNVHMNGLLNTTCLLLRNAHTFRIFSRQDSVSMVFIIISEISFILGSWSMITVTHMWETQWLGQTVKLAGHVFCAGSTLPVRWDQVDGGLHCTHSYHSDSLLHTINILPLQGTCQQLRRQNQVMTLSPSIVHNVLIMCIQTITIVHINYISSVYVMSSITWFTLIQE